MGRKKLARKAEPPSKRGIAWPRWTGFRGMTLRSWLELLVVPLALVVIGFLFSVQQDARQQRIENQRAEAERELAVQRAQDEALQAYLNQMSSLLLERDLRTPEEGSEVRTLARARTLTVLSRFDPSGKAAVMQFLEEATLVNTIGQGAGREPIINLHDADLSGADLNGALLTGADLYDADLSDASLRRAYVSNTDLSGADLNGAYLRHAYLYDADLSGANLRDAYLGDAYLSGANLSDAYLGDAYLSGANLSGNLGAANLSGANLSGANLSGAEGISNEELDQQAVSLKGATMPNGQKYEVWLKDKEAKGKDEKNK